MYLGKKTLNLLYIMNAISVILLLVFLVGPELLIETTVAEFMMKYRGMLVYHCIISALITVLFRKFHEEVSVEIKSLQNRLNELEKNIK